MRPSVRPSVAPSSALLPSSVRFLTSAAVKTKPLKVMMNQANVSSHPPNDYTPREGEGGILNREFAVHVHTAAVKHDKRVCTCGGSRPLHIHAQVGGDGGGGEKREEAAALRQADIA